MFRAAPGKSINSYAPFSGDMTMNGQKFGQQMSASLPMQSQRPTLSRGAQAQRPSSPSWPPPSQRPTLNRSARQPVAPATQPAAPQRPVIDMRSRPTASRSTSNKQQPTSSPAANSPGRAQSIPQKSFGEKYGYAPRRAPDNRGFVWETPAPAARPPSKAPFGEAPPPGDSGKRQIHSPEAEAWYDGSIASPGSNRREAQERMLREDPDRYAYTIGGTMWTSLSNDDYDTMKAMRQEFPGVSDDRLVYLMRERKQKSAGEAWGRYQEEMHPGLYRPPTETWTEKRNREMDEEARAVNEQSSQAAAEGQRVAAERAERARQIQQANSDWRTQQQRSGVAGVTTPNTSATPIRTGGPSRWPVQPPAEQRAAPSVAPSGSLGPAQVGSPTLSGRASVPTGVGIGKWAGGGSVGQAQGGMEPFSASYGQPFGGPSGQPNFQQRDAFISNINDQLGQMQRQSWQTPGMGEPQFDFPAMWGRAGDAVKQGWKNPLTGLLG